MSENILARIFEHNNWANQKIFEACAALTDDQLDAPPQSATEGSIRGTLSHLANAQLGYLRILTLPLEQRKERVNLDFAEVEKSTRQTGEALLDLVREEKYPEERLVTRDGHYVEPWVILLQIVNHATEHREQVKSMLTALGITPPSIDGWDYGESVGALAPITTQT